MIDKKIMMEEIRSLISEGYTVEITAKGYSMNPFIMHLRDIIVLGPWKDEEIRKGAGLLAHGADAAWAGQGGNVQQHAALTHQESSFRYHYLYGNVSEKPFKESGHGDPLS